jgi:hypothetical protein
LPGQPAVDLFERFDNYAGLRNALRVLAADNDEWAGIPLPMADNPLIVEPTYPKAADLTALYREPESAVPEGCVERNRFWSWRYRSDVFVWEENGRILHGPTGTSNHLGVLLKTLTASSAWGIEQEATAVQTLGTLVRHHQLKQYLLTGMFLEKSKRSGVMYLFRRLRPTIALSVGGKELRALCALCLHPIAYYEGSWGGAMTPTDDVLAHLMLMRGDEHMFWRRANQHPIWKKEAGV